MGGNYNLERQLLLALKMQVWARATASVNWLDGSGVWFDAARTVAATFLRRFGASLAVVLIAAAAAPCTSCRDYG